MKIWLVEMGDRYESSAVAAAFSNREKAVEFVENYISSSTDEWENVEELMWEQNQNFIDVYEIEVQ